MRVLFIGNSHTYCNDMPQIFAQICRAEGVETAIAMLAHGGVGWDFHWKEPEARFNLLYGGYDAVVLQHCAHPMGDLQVMAQAGAALIRLAKAAGARPILYMTWTQEADGEQAQPAMSRAYTSLAQAEGGALAPVGNAWRILRRLSPDTELFAPDRAHASPTGSRLAAYAIACAVLEKRPEEFVHAPAEDKILLKAIAEALV